MCEINCFLLAVILIIFLQETHDLRTLTVFMQLYHIWAHTHCKTKCYHCGNVKSTALSS